MGNFTYPVQSAIYQVPSRPGSLVLTATWSGAPDLDLSVNCPGAERTLSGASGLSLSLAAGEGSCTAVLAEPSSDQDTVSYTLTVDFQTSADGR